MFHQKVHIEQARQWPDRVQLEHIAFLRVCDNAILSRILFLKNPSKAEVVGHGHELNGHRCPCPRHGHRRGHGHEIFENRDMDVDMDTRFLKTVTRTWTWTRDF